jgi:hypothetical protein
MIQTAHLGVGTRFAALTAMRPLLIGFLVLGLACGDSGDDDDDDIVSDALWDVQAEACADTDCQGQT